MAGMSPTMAFVDSRPRMRIRFRDLAARWCAVLVLLALWWALSHSGTVTPFMLPSPERVATRIWNDGLTGELWINIGLTLYRALAGFVIAAVLGIAIGAAMSRGGVIGWFFDPIVSVGFPMPKITFLPVIVLWLGFYDTAKISMVVFDAIFPVITGTILGIKSVEKELIWSARSLGSGEKEIWPQIVMPAAMPQMFTGLQVSLPIAMIVAVVAEMLMGGYGMGGAMVQASRMADSPGVFAGIVEIAIVGWFLVKAMSMLRKRLLAWHPEAESVSGV
jgi:ABC-type nitrate/sulfonate/bicarbonate transport system permease component